MKTITILAAVAAALTSTIGMAHDGAQRFVHDGRTYVYTTTAADGGATLLQGRRYPDGTAFRLVVRGGRVTGRTGGIPVAFTTTQAQGAAADARPADVVTAAR